jgi:hypothetical protein
MKCNETQGKWCKNKHGASKIIDTFEMYQLPSAAVVIVHRIKVMDFAGNAPLPAPYSPPPFNYCLCYGSIHGLNVGILTYS